MSALRGTTVRREVAVMVGEVCARGVRAGMDPDPDRFVAYPHTPRPPARENASAAAPHGLTPRQHEIALLVTEGMTNRQISSAKGISEWTVTNHPRAVMRKPGCGDRVHVVGPLARARR
ncbi:helix-turn-helix transcriptional regulator [Streptomyces sp. NPDC060366]|uniref:helix-turn-helix domain-containing protein n=1 Tax=Streptomyces sp. NPDC060366 TaxID=3347105 RepID=UPI0036674692